MSIHKQNPMLKRRIDKMLTHGMGSQLLLLLFAVVLFYVFFLVVSLVLGWNYGWQDILALFLDPGGFGGAGEHDGFRLIVTVVGILLFSTLLISVVNNIFDNISHSAKTGVIRYRVKGHTLIFGSDPHLIPMLDALYEEKSRQIIVVMTETDVEELSAEIDAHFIDDKFMNRLVFYRGNWDTYEDILTARPQYAERIYVIGEPNEVDHDSKNIRCYNQLKTICAKAKNDIRCFVMMESGSTIDMFMHEENTLSTDRLKVDLVNTREYAAEQVLACTKFLPVIKADDPRFSHFVILGTGAMAKAVAFTVAHNSHYPRLNGSIRRTKISVIDRGVKDWMDFLVASRPELFKLSHYSYIAPDGTVETHQPEEDFLDIEWEFIDHKEASPFARQLLEQWAADHEHQYLRIAICHADQTQRIATLLHLPKIIYDKNNPSPTCIYLEHGGETALHAMETGNYGIIKPFGPALGSSNDPLFNRRSKRGTQVNAIYLVGKEGLKYYDQNTAWFNLKEADKFASTYCTNALNFRWINFDPMGDREPLYEAEHRRWMTTKLLMGLEHQGITAYDKVPQWKIQNFRNLIDWTIDYYKVKGEFPNIKE